MARILIIEDQAIWLELLEDIVRGMGYEVCSAASFTEAQELLARLQFDLVLVDIGVDNSPGFAVSREPWDLLFQRLSQVPVIAITSLLSEPGQLHKWRDLVKRYRIIYAVSKRDFDPNEFRESINQALSVPKLLSAQVDTLRVDAAVQKQVRLDWTFDLAVVIRQRSSPVLKEDELEQVRSGDVQVSWPETEPSISLRVQVSAPDCEIPGPDSHSFRLYVGHDSPVFYFHLIPKKLGEISIIVRVFQEDDWLGGTRVHTVVHEQFAGSVQMTISSQEFHAEPVGADSIRGTATADRTTLRQMLVVRFSLAACRRDSLSPNSICGKIAAI